MCATLLVTVSGARCTMAQVAFETVALIGEPAPGTTEEFLGGFGFPVINEAGQVAFAAAITGDTNIRGLWSGTPESLGLVSRRGDPAPGASPGATFSNFVTPTINANGQTAFQAILSGTPLTDSSMWAESNTGLRLVAREGDSAPGTDAGTLFDSFGTLKPVINKFGQTAFLAELRGAAFGDGIWSEGSGSLQLIAQSSKPAPGTPTGVTFGPLARPLINNAGMVAFRGNLSGPSVNPTNNVAMWIGDANSLSLTVREGDLAPGMGANAMFSSFESPALNESGLIVFGGFATGLGVTSSNNGGIWAGAPGALNLVARKGDAAPGASSGVNYNVTLATQINDAGQIAFVSSLVGQDVVSTNDFALFAGEQNSVKLIAREGSPAPGTEPGVVFANFDFSSSGTALANSYELNDVGGIVFRAFLGGPGVDGSNNEGIWMTRPDGSLEMILRKGDLFDVNDDPMVEDLNTISSVFFTDGDRGERSSLNSNGEVTFSLFFEGGEQGIFVASLVPEPSAFALLLMASPCAACMRRRVPTY